MLWKYDYHCPHCNHQLTKDTEIHFDVKTEEGIEASLYLSTIPGVFGYQSDQNLLLNTGDSIEFYCQSCSSNLQSESHPQYVEVSMKVSDDIVFEVFFSPVYGEKVTYVMMENELVKYNDQFFGVIKEHYI